MKKRLAIIDGIRTPFCKAGGVFNDIDADDLGALVVKELLRRNHVPVESIDEVIVGNAVQPVTATNVSRIVALKAGLPPDIPAFTVQRNCASGFQCLTSAANKILAEESNVIIAAATESMSRIPFLFGDSLRELLTKLAKARSLGQKLSILAKLRPKMLKPVIGLEQGLSDPFCGMNMGQTAELLSREYAISRSDQDHFALDSHKKSAAAMEAGRFSEEILATPVPPKYKTTQENDDGIRAQQTIEALSKLRPYFDRIDGTVTAGNASQVTDGAVATLVMSEDRARELGLEPLGYLREYAFAGIEGQRMGLGPVVATSKLLSKTGLSLSDFSVIELNEAFAAQVLACEKAMASEAFAKKYLNGSGAVGELPMDRVNVNGGAIALGHPVGATGLRLVVTVLKELRRRNKNLGLATLCVGGGQGGALALEVE